MNIESRLADIVGPAAGRGAHRALAQRPGRGRFPPLGARCNRRADPRDREPAARAGRPRARMRRHGHARLHPPPTGPAGHLRPPSARLCRDAGARRRPFSGRAQAPQRMPARRGGARRRLVSDRPGDDGQGARLRPSDRQFARQRLRPRLRPRSPRGRGDRGDPSLALRRGDRPVDDAAVRLRQAQRRLFHRLLDHAAEAQPRRRRTRARQDRPGRRGPRRAPDRDERLAARLCQGHAGGQGRGVRRAENPVALPRRDDGHGQGFSRPTPGG